MGQESSFFFDHRKAKQVCEPVPRKSLLDAPKPNVGSKRSTTRSKTKGDFFEKKEAWVAGYTQSARTEDRSETGSGWESSILDRHLKLIQDQENLLA